ncbi:hypothetical protein GCM10009798_43370 [Nocardioides panacihumi]|uniref:CBM-cenC domain-containing protein n=1 Tax=Nocardioides panacihumi TaxID=400774 RepID=A0ABN2RZD9_9ACTN
MGVNPLNIKQEYLPTDRLRLEVETQPSNPSGLVNLNLNPSGDLGAWGWTGYQGNVDIAGVSGTLGLRYTQVTSGVAGALQTYYVPVTAGQWVSARYDLLSVAASRNVKSYFNWYDANRNFLSASAISAAATTAGTYYATATQAPANTKYAILVLWLYNGTSGAATVGEKFIVRNVMVTKNATNSFTTVRTNLVTNPSFETNTTGWSANNSTIARSTTVAFVGTACLALTSASTAFAEAQTPAQAFPVTAGRDYTASLYSRAATQPRTAICILLWADASGAPIGFTTSGSATNSTSAWTRITSTATAPAGAAYASVWHRVTGAAVGEVHYIDGVMLEQTSTVGTYFDGATTNTTGVVHAWTGTANASASTETITDYLYVDPRAFLNIFNSSTEINISRAPLDASTLSATTIDPALDPADTVDDVLAVGRMVRVTALTDYTAGQVWEPIYVGSIDDVVTKYVLDKDTSTVKRRITFTANDAAQTIANVKAANGYDYIPALTQILATTNVPYLVNGFVAPVTGPGTNPVARNDDAFVIDQVAITRDTNRGLAWADRLGRIQVWDTSLIPGGINGSQRADILAPDSLTNCTRATVSASTPDGTQNVDEFTASSAGDFSDTWSGFYVPITAGKRYQVTAYGKANTTGRTVTLEVNWLGLDYASILGATVSGSTTDTTSGWTLVTVAGSGAWVEAPQGAYGMTVRYKVTGAASGEKHQVYKVLVAEGMVKFDSQPSADPQADSYSDIDVSFATHACINVVNINFNRYDAATGETTQIPYGPYVDQNSIDKNGPYAATFTIQSATEDPVAIAAYGAAVLAANANPARTANSITVPVLDADSIRHAVINDLCTLVSVAYYDVATSTYLTQKTVRIGTIEHQITPYGWLATYTFDPVGSVATPQVTPIPANNTGVIEGVWVAMTKVAGAGTAQYMIRNGYVTVAIANSGLTSYAAGSTITLVTAANGIPAGYRPTATGGLYTASFSGNAVGYVVLNPDGSIQAHASTAAMTSATATITYPIGA